MSGGVRWRLVPGSLGVVVLFDERLEADHLLGRVVFQPAAKDRFGKPTPGSLELEHLPMCDHGAVPGLFGFERAHSSTLCST